MGLATGLPLSYRQHYMCSHFRKTNCPQWAQNVLKKACKRSANMDQARREAVEAFRAASRRVLRSPEMQAAHGARTAAAVALGCAEPLQGALADWLYACPQQGGAQAEVLRQRQVQQCLGAVLWHKLQQQVRAPQALPQVNRLATRWSVLTQPSSDVPQRALLCGVDDSHDRAAAAAGAILAALAQSEVADSRQLEAAFLAHCVGAQDTLAFMLARRTLQRAGFVFGPAWQDAMGLLEQGGRL
jgi:hypothetical protein